MRKANISDSKVLDAKIGWQIVNSLPDNIAVLDKKGTIVWVNQRWTDFAVENSNSPEEAARNSGPGTNYLDVCRTSSGKDSEESVVAYDGIQSVLKGEQPYFSVEYPCHSPEAKRWFKMTTTQLEGAPGYVIVKHANITERKMAELLANDREQRFTTIFQESPSGICLSEIETGRLNDVNDAFLNIFGFARHETINHTTLSLNIWRSAEDRANLIARLRREGSLKNIEVQFRRKNGDMGFALVSTRILIVNGQETLLNVISDITMHKLATEALRERETQYRLVTENVGDVIWLFDLSANKFTFVSPSVTRILGYTPAEFLSLSPEKISGPEVWKKLQEGFLARLSAFVAGNRTAQTQTDEITSFRKDSSLVATEVVTTLVSDDRGNVTHIQGVTRDISARKDFEASLQASRSKLEAALASMSDAVCISDADGNFIEFNDAFATFHKFRNKAECAKSLKEYPHFLEVYFPDGKLAPLDQWPVPRALRGEIVTNAEYGLRRIDTGETWTGSYSFAPIRDARHDVVGSVVVGRDITEKKRAEEALISANNFLNSLVEQSPTPMWISDEQGTMLRLNRACCELLHVSADEVVGKYNVLKDNIVAQQGFLPLVESVFNTGNSVEFDLVYDTALLQGNPLKQTTMVILHVTMFAIRDSQSKLTNVVVQHIDITNRLKAEAILRLSEERFRALVNSAPDGIFVHANGEILFANIEMAKMLGFENPQDLIGRNAMSFVTPKYHEIFKARISDQLRTKRVSPPLELEQITVDETVVPIETSSVPFFYDEREASLVFVRDISVRVKGRKERDKLAQQLYEALESTVRLIASIVESRDPYTAGHQRRVANLARSIAQEMGMPEKQAVAVHFAGIIHDLGKISIPAEILSSPAKLSEIQMALIREHPSIGYNIVKDIAFPWPIADAIHQHHERLDGSGYPQGLKGEQISPEARILAVADVVEAMASHRPYRPALGIEMAMAEITKGRGLIYAAEVVDACLSLIRDKGYKL